MNTVFTSEEYKSAVCFADAMGLRSQSDSLEETATALDFAYAMGLKKRRPSVRKATRRIVRNIPVPSLRFI